MSHGMFHVCLMCHLGIIILVMIQYRIRWTGSWKN